MNRTEAVRYYKEKLKENGVDEREAETQVRFALSHVLNCDLNSLYLRAQTEITDSETYRMDNIIKRRLKGEPLEYIIGEKWFMGLRFFVSPDVLIPRNETEILCETAVQMIRHELKATVLDLCTGSGAIAVSIARYSRARVTACDISEKALLVAERNAKAARAQVELVKSDLFDDVEGRFDIITANPPYIPADEIGSLMREVREHEPRLALDGGRDGLAFYRRIAADASAHLKEDGAMIMEIGSEQAESVKAILNRHGFESVKVIKDYAGLDRVIVARFRQEHEYV